MEVCADSLESALEAARGGATRLELCSDLSGGGVTPTPGLLREVKSNVNIPVFVMLRPRRGDFLYSKGELEIMKTDAMVLKQYGANGFVFGALLRDGSIDEETCKELAAVCKPLPITFHRAIDGSNNPINNIPTLIEMGFDRVLTSGGKASALEGSCIIAEMISRYGDKIIIVPGGGITKLNIKKILDVTKAKEFHGSASVEKQSTMSFLNPHASVGSSSDYVMKVCRKENVSSMIGIYTNLYNKHDGQFLQD